MLGQGDIWGTSVTPTPGLQGGGTLPRVGFCRKGVFRALRQTGLRGWSLQVVPLPAWLQTRFVHLDAPRSVEDLLAPGRSCGRAARGR